MKTIFIIIFFFFSIAICHAQRFDGGVLLGVSASQIDGDNEYGFHKGGPVAGVWVSTDFDNKFSGQLELKYIAKGSAPPKDDPDPSFYRIRLQYIEIPVLVIYRVHDMINLEAGASLGYMIKEQFDPDGNGYYVPDGNPNRIEAATQAGINVKVIEKLFLNIRHSYSIFPFREFGYGLSNFSTGGLSNHVASVALYYQIGKD